jgi:ABC-2 type transport system ATP-binding protein
MEMLEKVALTDKAKAKYKELSGGQKQTVLHCYYA